MMIYYTDSVKNITPSALAGFFVGWPNPPSSDTHWKLLLNSDKIVLAVDGDKVVGFITAVTDGVLSAYIPLLEVLPAYQGKGIGSELTKRMLEQLKDLYMVDIICDNETQPFYARFGMREAVGMMIRRYDRQTGKL